MRPTHHDRDRSHQNAAPFSQNNRFWTLFAQWVCTVATTPPQVAAAPPPNGGNCAMQGCDTPATRRKKASHGAKPPHRCQRRAPQHPTGRLGHQGTADECDTNSQSSDPTVRIRSLGATISPEATSWAYYGHRTDQQEVPRFDVQLGSAATHIVPSTEICILCSPPLKSLC